MFVVKTKNKPMGNLGIAWTFPVAFVWKDGPHVEQTIRHEKIHMIQWLEVWILSTPGLFYYFGLVWWLPIAIYASYLAVYLALAVVTKKHPMEVDAREWQSKDGRPYYYWLYKR